MTDQVFEVYVRNADGDTRHMPLREALTEFLDLDKGYRVSINIEGVVITLRNSWDRETIFDLDRYLNQTSIEAMVTIRGLNTPEEEVKYMREENDPGDESDAPEGTPDTEENKENTERVEETHTTYEKTSETTEGNNVDSE